MVDRYLNGLKDGKAPPTPSSPSRRGGALSEGMGLAQSHGREVIFIGLLPLLVLTSGIYQNFPPPGWADPGIYSSYLFGFQETLERYGRTYFSMRLAYTQIAALLHQLFDHFIAHYLISFGFYFLALVSIYAIFQRRVSDIAAFTAVAFLAYNPHFVAAMTRGYVDGPCIAYMLATIACLENIERFDSRQFGAGLAGFFGAMAVNTHPIAIIYLFYWAVVFIWMGRRDTAWLRKDLVSIAIGFAITTLCLALMSHFMGTSFYYLKKLAAVSSRMMHFGATFFRSPDTLMAGSAGAVVPVVVLALGVLAGLRRAVPIHIESRYWRFVGYLAYSLVAMAIFDYLQPAVTLQYPFYTSFLTLPAALAAGALAGLLVEEDSGRWSSVFLVTVLPFLAVLGPRHFAGYLDIDGATLLIYMLLFGAILAALVSLRKLAPKAGMAILAALLVFVASSVALNRDMNTVFKGATNVDFRNFYSVAIQFRRVLDFAGLEGRKILFWYDAGAFTVGDKEDDQALLYSYYRTGKPAVHMTYFDTLASRPQWGLNMLNREMPVLDAQGAAFISQSEEPVTIAMIDNDGSRFDEAIAELETSGFATRERSEQVIEDGRVSIRVKLVDILRDNGKDGGGD